MYVFISLIIIECVSIAINILIFKWDILSPATISSVVFLIATLFALYCRDIWEINLSGLTVIVITLGLFTMTIGELLSRHIRITSNNNERINVLVKPIKPVNPNPIIINSLALIIVVTTLAYGLNAYHTGLMNGGSSLNAFAYMKSAYSEGGAQMNPIIRQAFKFIMASSYISCFMFSNNYLVLRQRLKDNFSYLIIIICGMVVTIFSGSRTEILRIISALILDYALIWRIYYKENNKKSVKQVLNKFMPLIILLVIIAFLSRTVVKKTGVATSGTSSIIYYVAYYVGSPIAVLNNKINFAFSKFDILCGSKITIPEFVYLGHLNYGGNVGSIFQTKLISNGLIIMMLWVLVIYFIGGLIYKRINYDLKVFGSEGPLLLLLFNSWYYVFTMSYYSDVLSSISFLETNFLIDVVLLILYPLFFKIRIK